MRIRTIKLSQLVSSKRLLLSYPLAAEPYSRLQEYLGDYPLIIVNQMNEVVFGIDLVHYLRKSSGYTGSKQVSVIEMALKNGDDLFLSFNLKEKFTGTNLFEKIVFLKRIREYASVAEIYKRTGIDLKIDKELLDNLGLLSEEDFFPVLSKNRIGLKAALKLCRFQPDDRKFMLRTFLDFQFSVSNQQKVLEITEELLFRERSDVKTVFARSGINPTGEEALDSTEIISRLFKFRFPMYSAALKKWNKKLKQIGLPENVKVTPSPFFEKNQVELKALLKNQEEMEEVLQALKNHLQSG